MLGTSSITQYLSFSTSRSKGIVYGIGLIYTCGKFKHQLHRVLFTCDVHSYDTFPAKDIHFRHPSQIHIISTIQVLAHGTKKRHHYRAPPFCSPQTNLFIPGASRITIISDHSHLCVVIAKQGLNK